MALAGLWGSVFSRYPGRIWGPLLHSVSARIGIAVGAAGASQQATPELLRERVLALGGAAAPATRTPGGVR